MEEIAQEEFQEITNDKTIEEVKITEIMKMKKSQ